VVDVASKVGCGIDEYLFSLFFSFLGFLEFKAYSPSILSSLSSRIGLLDV
jgi:hypothetical protein